MKFSIGDRVKSNGVISPAICGTAVGIQTFASYFRIFARQQNWTTVENWIILIDHRIPQAPHHLMYLVEKDAPELNCHIEDCTPNIRKYQIATDVSIYSELELELTDEMPNFTEDDFNKGMGNVS